MFWFPMDFGKLTIYGFIDTGVLRSALSEVDLEKIQFLALQTILNESPSPYCQLLGAHGSLEP